MAWEGFQRIGHGGASALAPANTLTSFDAAVAVGIDIVEFEVRERRDELVLAHTTFHAAHDGNVLLGDALAHLAGERFAGVDLNATSSTPASSRAGAHYRSEAFAELQLGLDGTLARPSVSTVYSAEGSVRPLNTRPIDPQDAD